ncbi:MAG: cyclic pyranopterin monophosphate synthase MoaC [Sulfobacillus thermotolerans]|uniref:Cyclic pyranopterin monophosphate synthase n=1 Tax=Sulfobacillus thermotolerans TaxID=338644 RepID=A0ABN5GZP6_9FIRM|nr:molybdenum cofactor biosynthesis protein C [Sulfobacillus thermotolerans]MCY0909147.1 cyclic pyranopterin monophosphate synthase MoaC [Sulfobacillus thermotolerans]
MGTQPNHLNERGEVHMVEVGEKPATRRLGRAVGYLSARPDICQAVKNGQIPKGDVLAVSRVAGIMAAKKTSDIIPLCHPLPLTHIDVQIEIESEAFRVEAVVETTAPTGVEMEALTAVSASLLTLYDMLKGMDRTLEIGHIVLLEKAGGRSGHFLREGASHVDHSDSHQ